MRLFVREMIARASHTPRPPKKKIMRYRSSFLSVLITLHAFFGAFSCRRTSGEHHQQGQAGIDQDVKTSGQAEQAIPTSESTQGFNPTLPNESDPDSHSPDSGCRGIDFLVVVDNSGSMRDEQSNLINSFPGFLETIASAVKKSQSSFHILVTDADSDGCEVFCKARPDKICPHMGMVDCADYDASASRTCETTLGAGRIENGEGKGCGVKNGRFLTSNDDNVGEAFRCLGSLGLNGDYGERMMQAATSAVSPSLLGPQGCNQGFLRKDAILVLLFVTDEEDDNEKDEFQASHGGPQDWYNAILEAKGGEQSAVVAVGLVGDVGTPNAICQDLQSDSVTGAERSPRLREFIGMFGERGRWGSVCAPDYNPFLQEVVNLVTESCDDFLPPPE